MKICTKCKELKPKSEFYKVNTAKDTLQCACKLCKKFYKQVNKEQIAEKSKVYRETNKEQIAEYKKLYNQNNKEQIKLYLETNKEQLAEYQKLYRETNKEQIKLYYQNNKEQITANVREYNKANPDKNAAHHHKRRALKAKSGGTYTPNDIQTLLLDQQGHCLYCKDTLTLQGKGKFHVDHRMPLFLGGTNSPDNLQLLCPTCNRTKSAIHPDIYESQINFKSGVDKR